MGRFQIEDLAVKHLDEIERLVDLVAGSSIHELTVRVGARRITVTGGIPRSRTERRSPSEAEAGSAEPAVNVESNGSLRITAPMVGVFHHSSPPAEVGLAVEPGQVIAVIESMKLMNDIRAEEAGTISKVHVADGLAVEYGQPLFDIERSEG